MKKPPNLNEMKFSRFDDGQGGRKPFDRAMHSQGMKVNDEDNPGGAGGSHRRYSLTPRKKGEDDRRIKTIDGGEGKKPTHLGYDTKKDSTLWSTGKKALRAMWREKGKTKEGSDKSPEAKDRRKKEAAYNKERKNNQRDPFKRKTFKEFYQPTMDSL